VNKIFPSSDISILEIVLIETFRKARMCPYLQDTSRLLKRERERERYLKRFGIQQVYQF
jgi:hypothetical protein